MSSLSKTISIPTELDNKVSRLLNGHGHPYEHERDGPYPQDHTKHLPVNELKWFYQNGWDTSIDESRARWMLQEVGRSLRHFEDASTRPLVYEKLIAFSSDSEKEKYASAWRDGTALRELEEQKAKEAAEAVLEDHELYDGLQCYGNINDFLLWLRQTEARKLGVPVYFISFGRNSPIFFNSTAEKHIMDKECVGKNRLYRTKTAQHEAREQAELEGRFLLGPVHVFAVRMQRLSSGWDVRIYDCNTPKKGAELPDLKKVANVDWSGYLVSILTAVRDGKKTVHEKKAKSSLGMTIVRCGGGNKATKDNPTGICMSLSATWLLNSVLVDLGQQTWHDMDNVPRIMHREGRLQIIKALE